jgi:hypothetical protein
MTTSNTLTPIEQDMFSHGFVRCPNIDRRWYAGHSGLKEPAYPMELRVSDAIWLVTSAYGNMTDREARLVPLMRFEKAEELLTYLERNGRVSEAGAAFSNSWD